MGVPDPSRDVTSPLCSSRSSVACTAPAATFRPSRAWTSLRMARPYASSRSRTIANSTACSNAPSTSAINDYIVGFIPTAVKSRVDLLGRDRHRARLLEGLEDDGRSRRFDARNRRHLLPQDASKVLGTRCANLDEVAVLARNVVNFLDLRNLRQFCRSTHATLSLACSHEHECREPQAKGARIESRLICHNDPMALQLTQSFQD